MTITIPPHATDFSRSCASSSFLALKTERFRLVRLLLAIYLLSYLGLSLLCGFGRAFAGTKVFGSLNLGYALVFGNYALAWVLAIVYLRRANDRHDALASAAIDEHLVSCRKAAP